MVEINKRVEYNVRLQKNPQKFLHRNMQQNIRTRTNSKSSKRKKPILATEAEIKRIVANWLTMRYEVLNADIFDQGTRILQYTDIRLCLRNHEKVFI